MKERKRLDQLPSQNELLSQSMNEVEIHTDSSDGFINVDVNSKRINETESEYHPRYDITIEELR